MSNRVQLFFLLILPSLGLIQRFWGAAGLTTYLAIIALIVGTGSGIIVSWARKLRANIIILLFVTTFALLLVMFAVGFPIANRGINGGSDRDDALNIAVTAILQGEYPYYAKTYLDNAISPMPGSFLLALPFVLLGNSAYQNLFWLLIMAWVMWRISNHPSEALLLFWGMVFLSPLTLRELVTGSDLLANSIFVTLFALNFLVAMHKNRPALVTTGSAILLGLSLASRANFSFIVPLLLAIVHHQQGWRQTFYYAFLIFGSMALLISPFYFYDPEGFTPIGTTNELSLFNYLIPHADVIIVFLNVLLALFLSTRTIPDLSRAFAYITIILAFPIITGSILFAYGAWHYNGYVNWGFTSFGAIFLPSGILAVSLRWQAGDERQP